MNIASLFTGHKPNGAKNTTQTITKCPKPIQLEKQNIASSGNTGLIVLHSKLNPFKRVNYLNILL